jgi:hypothetical protein
MKCINRAPAFCDGDLPSCTKDFAGGHHIKQNIYSDTSAPRHTRTTQQFGLLTTNKLSATKTHLANIFTANQLSNNATHVQHQLTHHYSTSTSGQNPRLESQILSASSHSKVKTKMCFIVLSTCRTCTRTLHLRYAPCSHAEQHNFDPVSCPNRMKRRQYSEGGLCGMCKRRGIGAILDGRKGSLSLGPCGILSARQVLEKGSEEMKERRKRKHLTRRAITKE